MDRKQDLTTFEWSTVIWCLGLALTTLVTLTWRISPWSQWDWGGATSASWVQAVGSVAAILVAIAVANHQSRTGQKAARQKEALRIEAWAVMFRLLAKEYRSILAIHAENIVKDSVPRLQGHIELLKKLATAVQAIPLESLQNERELIAVFTASAPINTLEWWVTTRATKGPALDPGTLATLEGYVRIIDSGSEALMTIAQDVRSG